MVVSSQGLPTVKANMAAVLGKRFGDAVQPFAADLTPGVHVEGCGLLIWSSHAAAVLHLVGDKCSCLGSSVRCP